MGAKVEFGISVNPVWADQDRVLRLVRLAEQADLDLVGIQDHPYQWRFYDTWTLLSFLAGMTSRIRFFPDVAVLPLRPPAMLAKAAASLDVLSGGRVELGLGAGSFWDAIGAMGGPVRRPGEAVDAVEEAIDVIRLVWSGERGVRYQGKHYSLTGLHTGPLPVHDMQIWIGARGPRMLDLIGRKGDGWVPSAGWAPPDALPGYLDRIRRSAEAAGRDPAEIRVVYNIGGEIGADSDEPFRGSVPQWVDDLAHLVDIGVGSFVFWPTSEDIEGQVERFAEEIAPGVRAGVED